MRRLGSIAALAAVAAVLASTPAAAAPPTKVLTLADSGTTVHIVVGQRLSVRLDACPSCGFHWATRTAPAASILRRLAQMQTGGCKAPCVGGDVTKIFRYSGRAAGTTSLRLEYLPPGSKTPAKTFRLRVRVTRA